MYFQTKYPSSQYTELILIHIPPPQPRPILLLPANKNLLPLLPRLNLPKSPQHRPLILKLALLDQSGGSQHSCLEALFQASEESDGFLEGDFEGVESQEGFVVPVELECVKGELEAGSAAGGDEDARRG